MLDLIFRDPSANNHKDLRSIQGTSAFLNYLTIKQQNTWSQSTPVLCKQTNNIVALVCVCKEYRGGGSPVEKRASIEWFGLTGGRRRREDVNGLGGSTSDKK